MSSDIRSGLYYVCMKVFFSWSGDVSRQVADTFRSWLPSVLQSVSPYFSPDDLAKGSRWASEISKELNDANFGLLFLTRDNLNAPWLIFEAGCISKNVSDARVFPILLGLKPTDVEGPLTQFQAVEFERESIRSLIEQLNSALGHLALQPDVLNNVWEKWWPDLEQAVSDISIVERPASEPVRDSRDILEEILGLVRQGNSKHRLVSGDLLPQLILAIDAYTNAGEHLTIVDADRRFVEAILGYCKQVVKRAGVPEGTKEQLLRTEQRWAECAKPRGRYALDEEDFDPFADE